MIVSCKKVVSWYSSGEVEEIPGERNLAKRDYKWYILEIGVEQASQFVSRYKRSLY